MPSIIILHDNTNKRRDLCFLVDEDDFPYEAVKIIQDKARSISEKSDSFTREDIANLAAPIIKDYYGTLVNFKLFFASY